MRAARRLAAPVLAVLLLAPLARGEALSGVLIVFPPRLEARFKDVYGADEEGVLRAAIMSAVTRALEGVHPARPLGARISVDDVAPTRPTRAMMDANPSLSDTRSKFHGGAALTAELRDAQGSLIETLHYDRYPPTVASGSPAQDPWADARLAIEGFAAQLAARLRGAPTTAAAPR